MIFVSGRQRVKSRFRIPRHAAATDQDQRRPSVNDEAQQEFHRASKLHPKSVLLRSLECAPLWSVRGQLPLSRVRNRLPSVSGAIISNRLMPRRAKRARCFPAALFCNAVLTADLSTYPAVRNQSFPKRGHPIPNRTTLFAACLSESWIVGNHVQKIVLGEFRNAANFSYFWYCTGMRQSLYAKSVSSTLPRDGAYARCERKVWVTTGQPCASGALRGRRCWQITNLRFHRQIPPPCWR